MAEPLAVVGMDAGGPQGLSAEARALVAQADVLAGGRRQLDAFPGHAAERQVLSGGLEGLEAAMAAWRQGRRVVVLASGDPGFFGVAAALRRRLGPAAVRVLPAVSSVQLAFARAGLAWEEALFVSAHGRPAAAAIRRLLGADWTRAGVLLDGWNTPPRIAAGLIETGLADCRAVVGERLGAADERVTETRLARLAAEPADAYDPLSLLVLERRPTPRPAAVGRPESDYSHERGRITKAEVRAVGLSKLRLSRGDTVWDVGAGCGSVAVEAAAFTGEGPVYAVERGDLSHLRENVRRFQAANLTVVAGEAPAALAVLPAPDAVFVGGSGGRLGEILDCIGERLRPGGRLVAHFVTVEHLMAFRCRVPWPQEVVQVAVGRGETLAGGLHFAALGAVWICAAARPL